MYIIQTKWLWLISLFIGMIGCKPPNEYKDRVTTIENPPEELIKLRKEFNLQGHRGARGLLPENSIPGFLKAVDLGVKTLELDVVVSKDKKMIVSHEPFFSHKICLNNHGDTIHASQEKEYNIYRYTVKEIQQFDCGSLKNEEFPEQKNLKTKKPTLQEVIKKVEIYIGENNLKSVKYAIETKCTPGGDSIYHPKPKEFVEILYNELESLNIIDKVSIQSFDVRTLQEFKQLNEEVPLVLLVQNNLSLERNIKHLGFTPSVYSPFFQRLTKEEIEKAHVIGMKVIPWTVNKKEDMIKLKKMGIDGLITDYPNRYYELKIK